MLFSILIIVKNRHEHLLRVLEGIALSSLQPAEIIIVHMNEAVSTIDTTLPITQLELRSEHSLPLAAARNLAAKNAKTEQLIFLDVDCIPAPDCFAGLLKNLENSELVMADPLYLQQPVTAIDYAEFEADGRLSPARKGLQLGDSEQYELFWSLGFAICSEDFAGIGGFDESYVGYGGEDTDFAFRARRSGLRLRYSMARIYHQNHPSYDPPLNWLEDIVTNAAHFKKIWGDWPMQGWLRKFAAKGYIEWSDDAITIKRLPTEAEIAAAKVSDAL